MLTSWTMLRRFAVLSRIVFMISVLPIAHARSEPAKVLPFVINDGDSLLAENGSRTHATSFGFALRALGKGFEGANVAIAAITLNQMVRNFDFNVGERIFVHDRPVILHVLGGGNDLRHGALPDDIFDQLRVYVAHAQALNMKVLVGSYPLQCDIFKNPDWAPRLKRFNDLIYASWAKPREAGGLGADGLVDYFANPMIGPADYEHSAFCDHKQSPDGAHLADGGKTTMGEIEADSIRSLLSK